MLFVRSFAVMRKRSVQEIRFGFLFSGFTNRRRTARKSTQHKQKQLVVTKIEKSGHFGEATTNRPIVVDQLNPSPISLQFQYYTDGMRGNWKKNGAFC